MRWLHPDVPFVPRRSPVFYGWVVLFASTVGIVMSIPGQTMGVSVFTDSLMEATGLSRLALANAYFAGTTTSGVLLPRGGKLIDRFGARSVVIATSIGLALTLVLLSSIDSAARAAQIEHCSPEIISWIVIMLGFVSLRFCGQGMLTMVSRTMLGKWFDRRRGLVSSISGVFIAFSFAVSPLALNAWIEHSGWRGAYLEMALVVGIGMSAVGWLFYRDNPEECGLVMDGRSTDGDAEPEGDASATRSEAVRTLSFWSVALPLAVQSTVITGLTFHIVDVGAGAGLTRDQAIQMFLPITVVSTSTGMLVGWIADRVQVRSLVIVMLCAEMVGYLSLSALETSVGYLGSVVGLGITAGFWGPLALVALPRLFGRTNLGAITGVLTMLIVVGSGMGPPAFALSRALTGSYASSLVVAAALPGLALILTLFARHPNDIAPLRFRKGASR